MGNLAEKIDVEPVGNDDLPLLIKGDIVKTCLKSRVGTEKEEWDYWYVSYPVTRNQLGMYQASLEKIISPEGVPVSWNITQSLPEQIKNFRKNTLDHYAVERIIHPDACLEIKGKEVSCSSCCGHRPIRY